MRKEWAWHAFSVSIFSFLIVDRDLDLVFLPSLSSWVWTCFFDLALDDDLGLLLDDGVGGV